MNRLFLFLLLIVMSCDPWQEDDIACSQIAITGLNVTVKNAVTQAYLAEGVTITATEGDYSENLELMLGNPPTFTGAWEREGTYIIAVNATGYSSFTSQPVTVTADRCHVISQQLEIFLQPE